MDPIILVLRILFPLSILHFPLFGSLISLGLDGLDFRANFFHIQNLHLYYSPLDKLLDIYYLTFEAYIAWKWKNLLVKRVALGLFLYRVIGVLLFFLTKEPILFVIFPNVFELFFIFYLCCKFILRTDPRIPKRLLLFSIIILSIPKIFQEYLMHVSNPWNWRYVQVVFSPDISFLYDNIAGQILILLSLILITCAILASRKSKR